MPRRRAFRGVHGMPAKLRQSEARALHSRLWTWLCVQQRQSSAPFGQQMCRYRQLLSAVQHLASRDISSSWSVTVLRFTHGRACQATAVNVQSQIHFLCVNKKHKNNEIAFMSWPDQVKASYMCVFLIHLSFVAVVKNTSALWAYPFSIFWAQLRTCIITGLRKIIWWCNRRSAETFGDVIVHRPRRLVIRMQIFWYTIITESIYKYR